MTEQQTGGGPHPTPSLAGDHREAPSRRPGPELVGKVSAQKAPVGAGKAGRKLWAAIVKDFDLDEHELVLLRQAVRVLDACENLQAQLDVDGLLLDNRTHPALVELRQQRILLARLIVALRVPLGEEAEAGRTQYRGPRGVYGIKGGAA